MERAGLWETQPMKRRERGSEWKSLERKRVEQGKKGESFPIKPPHTDVSVRMPHSRTVKPSNRHWGHFSIASSGGSLLITTKCSTTLEKKKPGQSSCGQKYGQSKHLWLLSHFQLSFVALATKTSYVRAVAWRASLTTSLWDPVLTEKKFSQNTFWLPIAVKNRWSPIFVFFLFFTVSHFCPTGLEIYSIVFSSIPRKGQRHVYSILSCGFECLFRLFLILCCSIGMCFLIYSF